MFTNVRRLLAWPLFLVLLGITTLSVSAADHIRKLQEEAVSTGYSPAAHWGWQSKTYSLWQSHSNRLIPVYTFGTKGAGAKIDLQEYVGKNSVYRNEEGVKRLFDQVPHRTVSSNANYMDQTDIYRIQRAALEAGKKNIFLVIFDGMDWQTTRAASIHNLQRVAYTEGRGEGTHFQDYDANGTSQFGFMVTTPHNTGTSPDVDTQTVKNPGGDVRGGYDAARGGPTPWTAGADALYLVAKPDKAPNRHAYTDSASSATSMTTGIKTYNGAIGVASDGHQVESISHDAQARGYKVGIVSSVPISHATPAAGYAQNVSRYDYQDLTRDLLGLPSISHPKNRLAGLDVVLGGGYGVLGKTNAKQGRNYVPGNSYLTDNDLAAVDTKNGGRYVVAQRTSGVRGSKALAEAAALAAKQGKRLLGFYGIGIAGGHLPFQTADGDYQPVPGQKKIAEPNTDADVAENPTLADMTAAALQTLESKGSGIWLLVEAGDVDWANHDNNLDNSIGAVNNGDSAVRTITDWVEKNSNWDESIMIVTADHGHYLFIDEPELLIEHPAVVETPETTQESTDEYLTHGRNNGLSRSRTRLRRRATRRDGPLRRRPA